MSGIEGSGGSPARAPAAPSGANLGVTSYPRSLQVAAQLASLGAGAAVYVYLVGGVLVYARYLATDLPAGAALAQSPTRDLLVRGVETLVAGVVLYGGAILLMQRLARWTLRGMRAMFARRRPQPSARALGAHLLAACGVGAFVGTQTGLAIAVGSALAGESPIRLVDAVNVGASTGMVLAGLFALAPTERLLALDPKDPRAVRTAVAIGVVCATAAAILLALLVPVRAPLATLNFGDGQCMSGAYLASDSNGVTLMDSPAQALRQVHIDHYSLAIGATVQVDATRLRSFGCPAP